MECPACRFDNRKTAKFCIMCGKKMGANCPVCDAYLPADAQFCDQCGHVLAPSAPFEPEEGGARSDPVLPSPEDSGTDAREIRGSSREQTVSARGGKDQEEDAVAPAPYAGFSPDMGQGAIPLYIQRDHWRPKTRFCLFLTIFYVIAVSFLLSTYLFPDSPLVQMANIFNIFWANFFFLAFVFLLVAWCVYGMVDFCYFALMRSRWFRPKLGEVLKEEGYVTAEELAEALAEQGRRIGEILVQQGCITREELEKSLQQQRGTSKRIGDILLEKGYITQEDLHRALELADRRLGQILEEKGFLREYELYRCLGQQRFGVRTIKWD
jgi:hypothetical protein